MQSLIASVTAILEQKLGLAATALGDRLMESILTRRLSVLGLKPDGSYLQRLLSDPQEFQALIEALVVPESWFFRYPASFSLIVEWAQKRRPTPCAQDPFRILIAPCAQGEEAYSAILALANAGWPLDAVELQGVDISQDAIHKARQAIYPLTAFRESSPPIVAQLLQGVPFRPDGRREVLPKYRAAIRWTCQNLVDPQKAWPPGPFDVICCRNLLIYLNEQARQFVLNRLESLLTHDGLLLLGHAEANALKDRAWVSIDRPQSFAYRRIPNPVPVPVVPPGSFPGLNLGANPVGPTSAGVTMIAAAGPTTAAATLNRLVEPTPDTVLPMSTPLKDRLTELEARLNQGSSTDLLADLEAHAAECPTPRAFTVLGVAFRLVGRLREAEQAFTQALYLDSRDYDALVQQWLLALQRGDGPAADNYRRRAVKVAQSSARSIPPTDPRESTQT